MPSDKRTVDPQDPEIQKALEDLKAEERATAQAQVAAIRADAASDAFASLFADIAARRKVLQEQQRATANNIAKQVLNKDRVPQIQAATDISIVLQAMEQAWRVLTSEEIEKHIKRDLLLTLVGKVICHKNGAEVVFLPGMFGNAREEHGASTLYTTCIGMSTQR